MNTAYKASEILKFLTRSCHIRFSNHAMGQYPIFRRLEKNRCSEEVVLEWILGTKLECRFMTLVCKEDYDVFENMGFERQCKMFLDKCFEVVQEHNVIAYSYEAGKFVDVMRHGTYLEETLMKMDLAIGLDENLEWDAFMVV